MANITLGEIELRVAREAGKILLRKAGKWLMTVGLIWLAIQSVAGIYVGVVYPCEVMAAAGINITTGRCSGTEEF